MKNMKKVVEIIESTEAVDENINPKKRYDRLVEKKVTKLKKIGRVIPDGKVWKNLQKINKKLVKLNKDLRKKGAIKNHAMVVGSDLKIFHLDKREDFYVLIGVDIVVSSEDEKELKKHKKLIDSFRFGREVFRIEKTEIITSREVGDSGYGKSGYFMFYAPDRNAMEKAFNSKFGKDTDLKSMYNRARSEGLHPRVLR